ncbi:oligopeptide/dipeptide ABC transporter ATP-binding protein [Parafrankia sp. FMc6]|uniref:oligopeptide/dipeptide ABC transporter ATP-binding protein n=1 Tax=Parafrankia soli TaxID=2599596 RepID=UPI0034D58F0F
MYGGEIIESAPTEELFAHPRHPYTRALLEARPSLDLPRDAPLPVIPGVPVNLADPPAGCRFAARCPSARERCAERPRLTGPTGPGAPPVPAGTGGTGGTASADDDGHLVACWYPHPEPAPGGGHTVDGGD